MSPVRDAMKAPFEALERTLVEVARSGPVYYRPNRGNWGDALIDAGARRFFAQIGLDVRVVSDRRFDRLRMRLDRGVLVYGGGGAWYGPWRSITRPIEADSRRHRRVIVLPSTFAVEPDIPGGLFFARDESESMRHVPQARFCHDLAFLLQPEVAACGEGEGWFLRDDDERSGCLVPPPHNDDLSARGTWRTPIDGFFDAVGRFEVVHTDRLHVAIAALLLGRELHLYAGSYFKNEAVFRSSMEPFFERAHFHPATQAIEGRSCA